MTDLSAEVLAALYQADPDQFLTIRASLAAEAKRSGDREQAAAITALRKPTLAAWIVNRRVHADPAAVDRLLELGTRLRQAHEHLDPVAMRELSAERRRLVTELTDTALSDAGRADAGANLRDDVMDTFDAAVADPGIAARLGSLTRSEKWSGFGVAMDVPPGTPELTVIRGGRHAATKAAAKKTSTASKGTTKSPADVQPAARSRDRNREKARARAAATLTAADTALHDAEDAERGAAQHVHDLTAQLAALQQELAAAKREHDRTRQELRSARNRRREARTTLTRAEREPT